VSGAADTVTSTTIGTPEVVGTVSGTVAGFASETSGEAAIADAPTAAVPSSVPDHTGVAASNEVAATSLAPASEEATTAHIGHGEAIHPTTTAEATAVSAEQQRQQAELAEQQRQQAEWDALTPEQQQLRRQQAEEHQAALLEQQQQAELAEQQRQQAEWDALSPEQQQLRRQQWEEHQRLLEQQRQQQLAHLTPEQQQQLLAQERQQQLAAQQLTPEQQQQLAHEQQLLAAQQQQHEVYQQQLAAHQQQQLLHQQHLAAHQVQQPIHQPLIPRIKRSDVRPVAGQDEELTRLNRFRFLNRTFASTAELKASCKEFGLSILRSDHDRVRLKLRGNTRTLLATFRLQKKSNPQQWRLSQDMSAEQVLQAWTTGNVNPEAAKLPTKRKSDDAALEDCKRDIKILHQQSPGLFQKVKEHVNHVFQSTGHSTSVVPTHLPMMHPNADVATAAAVQAHNLQQQQHQQYQQHLAAQHHHHQMQLAAAHAHDPRAAALAEEQHRAQLQAQQHAWNVAQQRGYNVNI